MRKTRSERSRKDKPSFLPPRPATAAPAPAKPVRRWRWWLGIAVCFALAGVATYVVAENYLVTRIPEALVGKWRVVGGEQDGVTLEFHRNGAFQATLHRDGQAGVVHARVEVDDKKLHIISEDPKSGKTDTKTHIIRELTENEMVLEDPRGVTSRLRRLE
jgi:uncharacterized protein (TIGR03066 family)